MCSVHIVIRLYITTLLSYFQKMSFSLKSVFNTQFL